MAEYNAIIYVLVIVPWPYLIMQKYTFIIYESLTQVYIILWPETQHIYKLYMVLLKETKLICSLYHKLTHCSQLNSNQRLFNMRKIINKHKVWIWKTWQPPVWFLLSYYSVALCHHSEIMKHNHKIYTNSSSKSCSLWTSRKRLYANASHINMHYADIFSM